MRVGIIGAGHRGYLAYGKLLKAYEGVDIKAVVDTDIERLRLAKDEFNIADSYLYDNSDKFFKDLAEKSFIDTLIIATPDRDHYRTCMRALDFNLHILLEKPISPKPDEVAAIAKKAKDKDKVFMVCHVLRYSPFFVKIKDLLDQGAIGKIMSINHNENIGYFHFSHSFVRGNWRNEDLSSPLILQKSCHDMDILIYLTGARPLRINSFGRLSYFKEENQPQGAADRCLDCPYQDECIYSAKDFYTSAKGRGWRSVVDVSGTRQGLEKALREGPYGRCIYKCDNNVCDHQSLAIEFDNDIEAVFNLSAFSNDVHRSIKIMGTRGEIIADDKDQKIRVKRFDEEKEIIYDVSTNKSGHGGADYAIIKSFVGAIRGDREKIKTGAYESIMSHMMCFASELSRKEKRQVDIKDYIKSLG